ncbi:MAG: hypothetical protein ACTSUE_13920 [Promethearchaeota archaeon]
MINREDRNKYPIIGKIPKPSKEEHKNKPFGPLSCLLLMAQPLLQQFGGVPKPYTGFAAITPLMASNAQVRSQGHHFHIMVQGPPEGGKNFILDHIKNLILPKVVVNMNSLSRRALNTDNPQNGGVIIQNEPPPFLTENERKLSISQREQLNEWKEMMSAGELMHQVLDLVKQDGQKTKREKRSVLTPLSLLFWWSANHVRNKGQAISTRTFPKCIFKNHGFQTIGSIVKTRSIPKDVRKIVALESVYHDLNMVLELTTIAINVGIIEGSTIGIMADILKRVLQDMRNEGISKTTSPRNFDRCLMVANILSLAGPIIDMYFMSDAPTYFCYKDLVILEPKLFMTTEALVISSGYLSEQWINPVRSSALLKLIKIYTNLTVDKMQLSQDDITNAKKTGLEIVAASQRIMTIRARKRKKTSEHSYVEKRRGEEDEEEEEEEERNNFDNSFRRIGGRGRRRGGGTKRKRRQNSSLIQGLNNSIEGGDDSITREESMCFELAIRRLDKIIKEVIHKHHDFSHYDQSTREDDYDDREEREERIVYNLNYIHRESVHYPKKIVTKVYHQMDEEPMEDEVITIFRELKKGKHLIPVHFGEITIERYNQIKRLYESQERMRSTSYGDEEECEDEDDEEEKKEDSNLVEQRLNLLRSIYRNNHEKRKKVELLHTIREKESKKTTILIHTSLFHQVDPYVMIKAIRSKIEHVRTNERYILAPVPVLGGSKKNDLEVIRVKRNDNVRNLSFPNPSYIPMDIINSRKNARMHHKKRVRRIKTKEKRKQKRRKRKRNRNDDNNEEEDARMIDEDVDEVGREREREKLHKKNESEWYNEIMIGLGERNIVIEQDLDEYLKLQRMKEMHIN